MFNIRMKRLSSLSAAVLSAVPQPISSRNRMSMPWYWKNRPVDLKPLVAMQEVCAPNAGIFPASASWLCTALTSGKHYWNRDQLYQHSPFLAPGFIGAKYCARDGVANPKLVAPAFAAAAQRLGTRIWEQTTVEQIDVQDGCVVGVQASNAEGTWTIETPLVLHAAGPWSPELGVQLGIHIPITPSQTIIGMPEPMPPLFTEFISSHDAEVFARPDKDGRIHIGAVAQPLGVFDECTEADVHAYLEKRPSLIPALGEANIEKVWWGWLAMTPDRQPVLGPVEGIDGYLLATGFSGHGFCLGPIIGKLMAEQIIDGEPSLNLDAFRLDRFAGEEAAGVQPRMIAG